MRNFLSAMFVTLAMGNLSAQHNHCGTDEFYHEQIKNNPTLKNLENQFNLECERLLKTKKIEKRATVYTIPVVFHVVHTNGPENISRAQIIDQIRILNEDYSYTNANKTALRTQFKGIAGSADIKFVLASIDPNGNCFDGVNRIYSPLGVDMDMTTQKVKNLAYWNYKKYLNIWVVSNITGGSSSTGTVLGYAVFPWMAGTSKDGIVMRQDYVGSIETAANSDGGRTLSHEVGHWLGLLHTFQDGCTGGDQCDDTPPVNGTFTNASCPANGNSCNNDVPDLPDMWENYMDYSNGKCMAAFTLDQIARMRYFATQSPRNTLFTAANLIATGVSTSAVAPVANFTVSATKICAGQSVTFSDLSCKGAPTIRSWTLTGSSTPSSTQLNPVVVYQTPGVYSVSLMAQNSYGSNTMTKSGYITVLPSIGKDVPYFEEGFEGVDPISNSTLSHFSPTDSRFQITTAASYKSTKSFVAPITTGSVGGNVYSFTTQSMDITKIPSSPAPKFTFYLSYALSAADVSEVARIYASTDCGGTFKQIWERSGTGLSYSVSAPYTNNFVPTLETQWKRFGIGSLSSIGYGTAQNVIFRIDVLSAGGNPVYIDNINLSQYNAGINHIAKENIDLTLYPNPAKGKAILKLKNNVPSNQCKITLIDMSGRLVSLIYEGHLTEGKQEFEITHPNNESFGLYIVSIETEFGTVSQPLIFSAE
jgi:PKD repeat protein